MTFYQKRNNGFTLIELLVVIAIIGVLASIIITSLNSARKKSRIASFVQYIGQIQNAFEVYHIDKGHYPSPDYIAPHDQFTGSLNLNGSTQYDYFKNTLHEYIDISPLNQRESQYKNIFNSTTAFIYMTRSHPWCPPDLNVNGQTYSFVFLTTETIIDNYFINTDSLGRHVHCIQPKHLNL